MTTRGCSCAIICYTPRYRVVFRRRVEFSR